MTPRVLLYCHNVLGFGHIVRSLRIAEELVARGAECRLITGCRFLDRIHIPAGVGVVQMPALRAEADGKLKSVDGGLLGTVLKRRSRMIANELRTWRPEVLLVDHNPLGLIGELTESIDAVQKEHLPARLIWGIRDIWSSPDHLRNMLAFAGDPEQIKRRILLYHSAIAYTDGAWLETLDRYRDFALPARTCSVGFVTAPVARSSKAAGSPIVAVLSGGGEGAARLTAILLDAARDGLAAGALRLRFVVGPFGSVDEVQQLAGGLEGVEIWAEGSAEDAIGDASLVVSRAGYNSAYTVVQSNLPVVFVPLRGNPEQELRASRLAELPGVESIDENDVASLRASMERGLAAGRRPRAIPFSTDGAQQAAEWILTAAKEALDEGPADHGR